MMDARESHLGEISPVVWLKALWYSHEKLKKQETHSPAMSNRSTPSLNNSNKKLTINFKKSVRELTTKLGSKIPFDIHSRRVKAIPDSPNPIHIVNIQIVFRYFSRLEWGHQPYVDTLTNHRHYGFLLTKQKLTSDHSFTNDVVIRNYIKHKDRSRKLTILYILAQLSNLQSKKVRHDY